MLIRSSVPRPPSNMEQKYEPRFPLLLSADDQFPRNYFKPCWPHTVYQRQDMFIAHGCQWKIESPPVQATKFARHESDNPFLPVSGGTSVALMKNRLSGKMSVFMYKNKYHTSASFSQRALMFMYKINLHLDVWWLNPHKSHRGHLRFSFGSGDAADPKHRSQQAARQRWCCCLQTFFFFF